ncbi:MAG: 3-hydroxybutyryl-CoA dehydrogenase [Sphingobacteriales bacterium]|nr:3-hydroxybutyryl-CoA dehydrogenase [Sphingobacteriales bacterium]
MNQTICICGAGTMGSSIAQAAAQAGFTTILFDVNTAVLEKAKAAIEKNLQSLTEKGKISAAEKETILNRFQFTGEINHCVADVIIEAIIEKTEAKVSLFNQLSELNHSDTVFASNTSSLSITDIQKNVVHPQRVVGMHFFNPATIMKLVEVVKGEQTNDTVAQQVYDLCKQMGKTPVMCKDAPGFIVNRVARHYYLEAFKLVEEGLADFATVDKLMEASGFKMGPFKLMDLIGNDINLAVSQSLYDAFNHTERFRPSPIQQDKVAKGELGKKTGKGYYQY